MVYIHVPFCRSFCTYCDFYSEITPEGTDFGKYAEGIRREAGLRREEILESSGVPTLYIGGGTPSLLPLSVLSDIVDAVGEGPYSEFTLEVNPEDIVQNGPGYARSLRLLGVNRISMGVQSLDDGMLRWMNRRHDSAGAQKAFGILRDAGFDNISVDIIFGISHMDDKMLSDTLERILLWKPEHVSAYQLSIEEGSALCHLAKLGKYSEAGEEQCSRQYGMLCSRLAAAGYHHYEISNWALPGREAVHNSAYWERKPYVGLGPGAHSLRGNDIRSWNSTTLDGWTSEQEHLNEQQIRIERIMLGLRTDKGVDGTVIPESEWFVSDSVISSLI